MIQKKDKYAAYLDKVSEVSTELDKDVTLRTIKIRVTDIFNELSDKDELIFQKNLFRILAIPALVVFLVSIVFAQSFVAIIGLFILGFYLIHHRKLMLRKVQEIREEQIHIKPNESKNISDLVAMIHYLVKGADLKISRMNSIRWFYAILFPLILVASAQFFFANLNFSELVVTLVFAAVIGGLFWVYHFYIDINRYEEEAEELENYLDQLEQY